MRPTTSSPVNIYRHGESVIQLPFEIIITMPLLDRDIRGYSNKMASEL